LIAFFNQMVFVQSRIAMLDISALAFGLAGLAFGLSIACKWNGLLALPICIVTSQ
jgi:dolichyl-phosphate-mannose-protein mannosyltransferase